MNDYFLNSKLDRPFPFPSSSILISRPDVPALHSPSSVYLFPIFLDMKIPQPGEISSQRNRHSPVFSFHVPTVH